MTAQIGDIYKLNDKEYEVVALSKPMLFNPKKYGLEPHMLHTGCRRGYCCVYEIKDNRLFLEKLYIHNDSNNYPPIMGVSVSPEPVSHNEDAGEYAD